MDSEVWSRLLSLESRDVVSEWFQRIHGLDLNARRAKEIVAASRQGREYFRNANRSEFSVKPLLTFYGVSSLARALSLLLRREGGEEGLAKGHGLQPANWPQVLSGDVSVALRRLGELRVQASHGLFLDLAHATGNQFFLSVRSMDEDDRITYSALQIGDTITLNDLFFRIPEIQPDYGLEQMEKYFAKLGDIELRETFWGKVSGSQFESFSVDLTERGYNVQKRHEGLFHISTKIENFRANPPQLYKSYNKGRTDLYILSSINGNLYSEICLMFVLGYYLGMLARYYPTYWMALLQGEKGDILLPAFNRAQRTVEEAFPVLVVETISYVLMHGR